MGANPMDAKVDPIPLGYLSGILLRAPFLTLGPARQCPGRGGDPELQASLE